MSTKDAQRVFTVEAVDNGDYNPSSTISKDSFHGTGISLIEHPILSFINQTSSAKGIAPL